MDIEIDNVVSSANTFTSIDLDMICSEIKKIKYNKKNFPGAILKLKDPIASLLIFSSGKIVCTGAKSIEDSEKAIVKTINLLREQMRIGDCVIATRNIVATVDFDSNLDLEAIHFELKDSEYEPEQFSGLVYKNQGLTFLLFSSGKIVCTAGKTHEDIKKGYSELYDLLKEIGAI